MQRKYLLAITSHGNAPYLMATRLAQALGSHPVIIPDYYGSSQYKIVQEEIAGCSEYVYFSKQLGELFKPLLLDVGNQLSFADFAYNLTDPANPYRIDQIESRLNGMLREGLDIFSFDLSTRMTVRSEQIAMILNSAQPIRTADIPQVYFFTAKLSRIYGESPFNGMDAILEKQGGLAVAWKVTEQEAIARYIPRINALSYLDHPEPDVIHTPPLAHRRSHVNMLERPSVVFVPSGTGTDTQKLDQIKFTLPGSYHPVVMTSTGFSKAGLHHANSSGRAAIYGDPLLQAVVCRGGWGTIWECLQNNLPLGVLRTTYLEDPEMGHTQLALQKLGLGIVLDETIAPLLEKDSLDSIKARITNEQNQDILQFDQAATNGLEFIARDILRFFPDMLDENRSTTNSLPLSGQEKQNGTITISG